MHSMPRISDSELNYPIHEDEGYSPPIQDISDEMQELIVQRRIQSQRTINIAIIILIISTIFYIYFYK